MAHILIVEARFYAHLNDMLIDGVRSALKDKGGEAAKAALAMLALKDQFGVA